MILFAGDVRVLRFWSKKDPTVEGWPELKITFKSEPMSNNTTSYTTTTSTGTSCYVSSGVGVGTYPATTTTSSYIPTGGSGSSC